MNHKEFKEIEDIFCEHRNKIILINDTVSAFMLDEELDPIKITFDNDYCVLINTSSLSHIVLNIENLNTINKLIFKAQKYYKEFYLLEETRTDQETKLCINKCIDEINTHLENHPEEELNGILISQICTKNYISDTVVKHSICKDLQIKDLKGLRQRTLNEFRLAGISCIGDIIKYTREEFYTNWRFAKSTKLETDRLLEFYGLTFKNN